MNGSSDQPLFKEGRAAILGQLYKIKDAIPVAL